MKQVTPKNDKRLERWGPLGAGTEHVQSFDGDDPEAVWTVLPGLTRAEEWMLALSAKHRISLRWANSSYEGQIWYDKLPRVKSIRTKLENLDPDDEKARLRIADAYLDIKFENNDDKVLLPCPLVFVDRKWEDVQSIRIVRGTNAQLDRTEAQQAIAQVTILPKDYETGWKCSQALEWAAFRAMEMFEGREAASLERVRIRAQIMLLELLEENRPVVLSRVGNVVHVMHR